MNRALRLQSIFNICYVLYKSDELITVDSIFKKLESKVPKTTISKDLKFMKSFVIPKGKQWIFTQEGIEAAEKDDIFKFSLME